MTTFTILSYKKGYQSFMNSTMEIRNLVHRSRTDRWEEHSIELSDHQIKLLGVHYHWMSSFGDGCGLHCQSFLSILCIFREAKSASLFFATALRRSNKNVCKYGTCNHKKNEKSQKNRRYNRCIKHYSYDNNESHTLKLLTLGHRLDTIETYSHWHPRKSWGASASTFYHCTLPGWNICYRSPRNRWRWHVRRLRQVQKEISLPLCQIDVAVLSLVAGQWNYG